MLHVHLDAVPWMEWSSTTGKYHGAGKQVSEALGAKVNANLADGGHPFDLEFGKLLSGKAGCALLSRRLRAGGWLLSALLGAVFLAFTGSALARGLDISCGCFGTGHRGNLPAMAALDVVIVILSLRGLAGCVRARRDTTAPRAPRTG